MYLALVLSGGQALAQGFDSPTWQAEYGLVQLLWKG
jgi:hypothetical protein